MIIYTDTTSWANSIIRDIPLSGTTSDNDSQYSTEHQWRLIDKGDLNAGEQLLYFALDCPEPLWRLELDTNKTLGYWQYLVIIDTAAKSQYDALREISADTLPGPVACIAATGRDFHGHNKRSWQAERGNLHLSTICNPAVDTQKCGLAMTALPAVAVMDSMTALTGPSKTSSLKKPAGIKWVNDILIDDCKVAGVLTATATLMGTMSSLYLGIGLNVDNSPQVPATKFVPTVNCLNNYVVGDPVSIGSALATCLEALSERLLVIQTDGPAQLLQAYCQHSLILNRQVTIWADLAPNLPQNLPVNNEPEKLASGVVAAINSDLSLVITGSELPITRGRLVLEK